MPEEKVDHQELQAKGGEKLQNKDKGGEGLQEKDKDREEAGEVLMHRKEAMMKLQLLEQLQFLLQMPGEDQQGEVPTTEDLEVHTTCCLEMKVSIKGSGMVQLMQFQILMLQLLM